jgi:hypothetical protein
MSGPQHDRGLNPRALHELLAHAHARRQGGATLELRASMFEIYNDTVRDLIGEGGGARDDRSGSGAPADGGNGFDVGGVGGVGGGALQLLSASELDDDGVPSGVFSARVRSVDDVMMLMAIGNSLRARRSTKLNTLSSRSHTLLIVRAAVTDALTGARTLGRMLLIDLAGSEDAAHSGANEEGGPAAEEARHINGSLAALGRVLRAHAARTPIEQIDYAGSALTELLRGSLSSTTKMVMLAHVSAVASSAAEVRETLEFASGVRDIELGRAVARNENCGRRGA